MTRVIEKYELPYGKVAHKFEGHRYGGVDVSFFLVDCSPGGGAVLHTHPYEEVFVTLEGEATFTIGDDTIKVGDKGGGRPDNGGTGWGSPQVRQLRERAAAAGRHPSQRTRPPSQYRRGLMTA